MGAGAVEVSEAVFFQDARQVALTEHDGTVVVDAINCSKSLCRVLT